MSKLDGMKNELNQLFNAVADEKNKRQRRQKEESESNKNSYLEQINKVIAECTSSEDPIKKLKTLKKEICQYEEKIERQEIMIKRMYADSKVELERKCEDVDVTASKQRKAFEQIIAEFENVKSELKLLFSLQRKSPYEMGMKKLEKKKLNIKEAKEKLSTAIKIKLKEKDVTDEQKSSRVKEDIDLNYRNKRIQQIPNITVKSNLFKKSSSDDSITYDSNSISLSDSSSSLSLITPS